MIVVEELLKTLFSQIPNVIVDGESFEPVFGWGDLKDLNIFLKQEQKKYPLIWLETGFSEDFSTEGVRISPNIVIATYGLDQTYSNEQKLDLSFKKVLFPLLDSVLKTFTRSNVVNFDGESFKIMKYYNYGDGSKHETTDIWDAIKLEVDLVLLEGCIKDINYG